jgi:hypothetical protein
VNFAGPLEPLPREAGAQRRNAALQREKQMRRGLAHPVHQGAVGAAARAERRHPERGTYIGRDLGGRAPGPESTPPRPRQPPSSSRLRTRTTPRTATATRVGANPPPGKLTSAPADRHAVAARTAHRRSPYQGQVHPQRQMPRIRQPVRQHRRLEQPRILTCPARHRRQIRRALMPALRPQRLPEREQHHRQPQQPRPP